jgi:hypothetical protein
MKLKFKMALLGLGASVFAFPFLLDANACARFWGDFLGDALLLSMID